MCWPFLKHRGVSLPYTENFSVLSRLVFKSQRKGLLALTPCSDEVWKPLFNNCILLDSTVNSQVMEEMGKFQFSIILLTWAVKTTCNSGSQQENPGGIWRYLDAFLFVKPREKLLAFRG